MLLLLGGIMDKLKKKVKKNIETQKLESLFIAKNLLIYLLNQ